MTLADENGTKMTCFASHINAAYCVRFLFIASAALALMTSTRAGTTKSDAAALHQPAALSHQNQAPTEGPQRPDFDTLVMAGRSRMLSSRRKLGKARRKRRVG